MKIVITEPQLRKLPATPSRGTKQFGWDLRVPCFGAYKSCTGRVYFVYQYRQAGGKSRRLTIGTWGEFEVEDARDVAAAWGRDRRQGVDPYDQVQAKLERAKEDEGLLFSNFLESFYAGRRGRVFKSDGLTDKPPIVTMAAKTIHASAGAATPEARRIVTVMVENPDVVPIDADSIVLEIPIDQRMTISDHPTGAFKAVEVVRGVEDGMGVSYGGLGDPTDDVECTSDGKDWNLQPVDPSQVRSVRIRVRGALQPSKSVVIALAGSMR